MSKNTGSSFLKISNAVAKELKIIDQIILKSSIGKADLIAEITNHLILSGGKRVRPILTILAARICGYKSGERHCNLAAAIEMIHSATLLHDDVVDDSDLRRGKKTANAIWDNKASILVGDYLFSVAFQLMVKDGSLEVLDILSQASGLMADGEVMQLMNSNDIAISEEKYLQIISHKTAILFCASMEVGAIAANAGIDYKNPLSEFGNNLGICFQIMDDILDYSANQEKLGKKIGNDFYEGKVTLPIILLYKLANDSERNSIKDIFVNNLVSDEENNADFIQIMNLIDKYDIMNESHKIAQKYKEIATQNLDIFPVSLEKRMLIEILDYCVDRSK